MLKMRFPHVVYKVVENQHEVLLKFQKYPDLSEDFDCVQLV